MTDNDKELLEMSLQTRTDYDFIEALATLADSEETRNTLLDRAHWAFKTAEAYAYHEDIDFDEPCDDDYS